MNSNFRKKKPIHELILLIFISVCMFCDSAQSSQTAMDRQVAQFSFIEDLISRYNDRYDCIPGENALEKVANFYIIEFGAHRRSARIKIIQDAWGNNLRYSLREGIIEIISNGADGVESSEGGDDIYYFIKVDELSE